MNPGDRVKIISYPPHVPSPEGWIVWEHEGKVSIWLDRRGQEGYTVLPIEEVELIPGKRRTLGIIWPEMPETRVNEQLQKEGE